MLLIRLDTIFKTGSIFNSCFYAHICEITTINHEFFTWGMLTPKVSVKVIYGVHECDFNVSRLFSDIQKGLIGFADVSITNTMI